MSVARNRLANGVLDVEAARKVRDDILTDADELAKKPFGWDETENGDPFLPVRQDSYQEVYRLFHSGYGVDLRCLPRPDLTLGVDGTIVLFFRREKRGMAIHVKCKAVVHCFMEIHESDGIACLDKLVRLAQGTPATGYAAEIDEWSDWFLGLEEIG